MRTASTRTPDRPSSLPSSGMPVRLVGQKTCRVAGCDRRLRANNGSGLCAAHFTNAYRRAKSAATRLRCATCDGFLRSNSKHPSCLRCRRAEQRERAVSSARRCEVCGRGGLRADNTTRRCAKHVNIERKPCPDCGAAIRSQSTWCEVCAIPHRAASCSRTNAARRANRRAA